MLIIESGQSFLGCVVYPFASYEISLRYIELSIDASKCILAICYVGCLGFHSFYGALHDKFYFT